MSGRGVQKFSNGDVYAGDYENGKKHGRGAFTYSNGNVYDGDYIADKRNGRGAFTFATGEVYEGAWVDNMKHGRGVMTYCHQGAAYDGDWIENKRHGRGVMTYANGNECDCVWEMNLLTVGTLTLPDGMCFEAVFTHGEVDGVDDAGRRPCRVRLTVNGDLHKECGFLDGVLLDGVANTDSVV